MRRLWFVGLAVVVASAFAAPGVASATTGGAVAGASCASLAKKYEQGDSSASKLNFSNPGSLQAAFKQLAKEFNTLASVEPSSLRAAFKALSSFYAHLESVNFSNPSSITQIETLGTQDEHYFEQIAQYFAQKCGLTIPTAPTGTP